MFSCVEGIIGVVGSLLL